MVSGFRPGVVYFVMTGDRRLRSADFGLEFADLYSTTLSCNIRNRGISETCVRVVAYDFAASTPDFYEYRAVPMPRGCRHLMKFVDSWTSSPEELKSKLAATLWWWFYLSGEKDGFYTEATFARQEVEPALARLDVKIAVYGGFGDFP